MKESEPEWKPDHSQIMTIEESLRKEKKGGGWMEDKTYVRIVTEDLDTFVMNDVTRLLMTADKVRVFTRQGREYVYDNHLLVEVIVEQRVGGENRDDISER